MSKKYSQEQLLCLKECIAAKFRPACFDSQFIFDGLFNPIEWFDFNRNLYGSTIEPQYQQIGLNTKIINSDNENITSQNAGRKLLQILKRSNEDQAKFTNEKHVRIHEPLKEINDQRDLNHLSNLLKEMVLKPNKTGSNIKTVEELEMGFAKTKPVEDLRHEKNSFFKLVNLLRNQISQSESKSSTAYTNFCNQHFRMNTSQHIKKEPEANSKGPATKSSGMPAGRYRAASITGVSCSTTNNNHAVSVERRRASNGRPQHGSTGLFREPMSDTISTTKSLSPVSDPLVSKTSEEEAIDSAIANIDQLRSKRATPINARTTSTNCVSDEDQNYGLCQQWFGPLLSQEMVYRWCRAKANEASAKLRIQQLASNQPATSNDVSADYLHSPGKPAEEAGGNTEIPMPPTEVAANPSESDNLASYLVKNQMQFVLYYRLVQMAAANAAAAHNRSTGLSLGCSPSLHSEEDLIGCLEPANSLPGIPPALLRRYLENGNNLANFLLRPESM